METIIEPKRQDFRSNSAYLKALAEFNRLKLETSFALLLEPDNYSLEDSLCNNPDIDCVCTLERYGEHVKVTFTQGNEIRFHNLQWLTTGVHRTEEFFAKKKALDAGLVFTCQLDKLVSAIEATKALSKWHSKGKTSHSPYALGLIGQLGKGNDNLSAIEYTTGSNDNYSGNAWEGYRPSIAKHFDSVPA